MKIRFAVTPPADALGEDQFDACLAACEGAGFDTLWLSDVPLGPQGDPLVSLCYAAGRTRRLKLGANVVPLGRNPLWLAKQLAQIDRLSHGRLLLSFVPGLGAPAERAAIGHPHGDRGRAVDAMIDLLRRFWNGEAVTAEFAGARFDAVTVLPRPAQSPLEIWLGGAGPAALERVATLADGWLTASVTPAEAGRGRAIIEEKAAARGRRIDPEHFGISIPYARVAPSAATVALLRERGVDPDDPTILPVGRDALARLIDGHLAVGISKFVLRATDEKADWQEDLAWLGRAVLPLQT